MAHPKYFIYAKGASYNQQFDCWKKIFENTFRNSKGADNLLNCENGEFIDCALSDRHIALLTKDGKVCRLVYRVNQTKSKSDHSPNKNDKNKDRKRPRLTNETEDNVTRRTDISTALGVDRHRLLANDMNPDDALDMRRSIMNSSIPHQLRRLRGISRNIIPDSLVNRIQDEFPQTPRDLISIILAQNNLSVDEAVAALTAYTRPSNPNPNNPTNSNNITNNSTNRLPPPSSTQTNRNTDPTTPNLNNIDSFNNVASFILTNFGTTPSATGNSTFMNNSSAAWNLSNGAGSHMRSESELDSVIRDLVSISPREFNSNLWQRGTLDFSESHSSVQSPHKLGLDCEDDMCIEVQSTIWYEMDEGVKIKRIFAMKSDLVMLDELGGLHQWNWRKLKPLMNTKMRHSTYHTHTRLFELGVIDERVVHIDCSTLRCCFSTDTNKVYTFLDRCIPFMPELNHQIPIKALNNNNLNLNNSNLSDNSSTSPIKNISVCNPYAVILMENGQASFWGLKSMAMVLPLQYSYLNELKLKDRNKASNFFVGTKVYNYRCALHREGSLVVDFSNDTIRFGRLTNDITELPQNIVVEVVKDYRDYGSFANVSKFSRPTKRPRSCLTNSQQQLHNTSHSHLTDHTHNTSHSHNTTHNNSQLSNQSFNLNNSLINEPAPSSVNLNISNNPNLNFPARAQSALNNNLSNLNNTNNVNNNLSNVNNTDSRNIETWRIDSVIFLDDMLDNSYRYELGVVMKVEKNNLIVCTDAELIDKPYKELSSKVNLTSLSVWKMADTHIFNEKNTNEVMSYVKYKLPSEPLKINSAVTGHKILAVSCSLSNIICIVERSNGEVTGAIFEYKGKTFKEIEFNVPDSIRFGLMNGNFTITDMKHFGDLTVLTTNDGGETIFRRCHNKSRVLDTPAFPLIHTIRMFSHHKTSSKLNKNFNLCVLLPQSSSIFSNKSPETQSSPSIQFGSNVQSSSTFNNDNKYDPEKLINESLFYQRQNILHVLAYEALYYGYKHNGINPDKELMIAKYAREFVRKKSYRKTIIDYLGACDINGFTPIIYAISIRSYHVANVYVEFVLDLLTKSENSALHQTIGVTSCVDSKLKDEIMNKVDFNNERDKIMNEEIQINEEDEILLLRAIFPRRNYSPNNSVYYMLCANDVCSFTWSGPKHIKQDIYQCYTCSLSGKLCCCSQCASVCHYGHNCLLMGASPTAYCDCWEISHCKTLIGGDQDMRLRLFKLLIQNVDLFGSSCNERWDILVAFLLYTESRPDFNQKPTATQTKIEPNDNLSTNFNNRSTSINNNNRATTSISRATNMINFANNSSSTTNNYNRNNSEARFALPPMPILTRKDPLSPDTINSTDIDRIYQRGLVHGFKITSFVPKFDFIIAALEIIFSNVSLVKRILTPRDLNDDHFGGNYLVNEYSQHNYHSIEEEMGTSRKQWDVRYVDSTVCYLIFKCKSDPLNRLITSLKNEQIINSLQNKPIIDIFIRSVCRVFNVFISGMSPALLKSTEINKYLDIFYELFAISPAMSVTTLITMANAIISPVVMNINSCAHSVSLCTTEADCIEKTVKMFILHPRISKNISYSEALMNRDNFLEMAHTHSVPPSPSVDDDDDEDDSDEDSDDSIEEEDDDDMLQSVDGEEYDSQSDLGPPDFGVDDSDDAEYGEEDINAYYSRFGRGPYDINPYMIPDGDEDHTSFSGDDDETSSSFTIEDEDRSSSSSDTDRRSDDGISENSDISHIFDNDDTSLFNTFNPGEFLESLPRFSQFSARNNPDQALNVIFNRMSQGIDNQTHVSPINVITNVHQDRVSQQRDPLALSERTFADNTTANNAPVVNTGEYPSAEPSNPTAVGTNTAGNDQQGNRLVVSLDWSINNSANRTFGSSTRDPLEYTARMAEGHPRVMSTLFNDNQPSRPSISLNNNRNAGNANNQSILSASNRQPTILTSNEASARSFASILRTITNIMKRFNMYTDENYSYILASVRSSFDFVTIWLFRIMDYTESLLRHGVTTYYRHPRLVKNEMEFLVQNYQQLHDTTNINWNFFRRNSAIALGEGQDDDEFSSNQRLNFLSTILSRIRSSHNEHLYMMPKVDISSMRYVAYIFDAFVYYMKEEKLSTINRFSHVDSLANFQDLDKNVQNNQNIEVNNNSTIFFKRTDSTLMLASLVPDELTTPLSEALPLADNPSLLTSTSTKKDLFGFSTKLTTSQPHIRVDGNFQPSRNPYSTNLFEYNQNNISGDLFKWDLVELYSRWNCCVTSFAKLFLKDVGAEPGSSLLEIGHYDTKVRSFKRLLNRSMYKLFKEYTIKDMPRDFNEILPITFEKLNAIFRQGKPGGNDKIPRITATFKDEPGEGQGVTRNFVNDVFLAIMTVKKLPDLKNVFLSTRSYLDFSLMDDDETFLDSCILRTSATISRLPNFVPANAQPFYESDPNLTINQKNIGRCILEYLRRKNVHLAELVTGVIMSFTHDIIMRCVTNHQVLYTYVKEIQVELDISLNQRVSKQQFYSNEDIKFENKEALFCEGGIKAQYTPLPGKRSRERINAFINVGRLIGQCIVLDVPCPLVFVRPVVKYLLGKKISWHDFAFYDGSLYESMRKMIIDALTFENKDEHLYDLYFAAEKMVDNKLEIFDLIPDGRNVIVTPRNVLMYVEKFCSFQMVHSVKIELEAMKKGLNQVIPLELFSKLTAEDFKLVVNGCTFVTVEMLKKVTTFVVEASNVPQARVDQFKSWFWSVCNEMTQQQRSELLTFWTSSPNLSADYLSAKYTTPTVTIKFLDDFRLPTANTCSTKLFVPLYSTKKILKTQLLAAIKCRTFGFV